MGDISSDTQAEFGMMLKAHGDLRKKDPAHELLGLVEIHEDGALNAVSARVNRLGAVLRFTTGRPCREGLQ